MTELIDIVVTWVDGADPAWLSEKQFWLEKEKPLEAAEWTSGDVRFRDWGLLRYWFRGIEECAPWVRTIHFVTCGHIPQWLNVSHPKLHIVKHSDFIPEEYLPTFNSHTIEFNMHRISALAEQFVYFNDDMYLLKKTQPADFFLHGLPRDFAGLDLQTLHRRAVDYRPYNTMILNEHFPKDEVMKKHRLLWFSPKYGPKCLFKTMLLSPFGKFSALQTDHLPINFLKSTFVEVWNKEPEILKTSCSQRFRGDAAVSPWLIRDWQRCEGKFVPKKPQLNASLDCGCFEDSSNDSNKKQSSVEECVRKIKKPDGLGLLCLNDYCESDEEFCVWKEALREAFDQRFPEKSDYEIA